MENNEQSKVDERYEHLENCVLKTFNLKSDRWQKCLAVEEQRQVILDFLDKADQMSLVVSLGSSGQLIPNLGFSGRGKNKSVYFVKQSKTALSVNTMKTHLTWGSLSHSPLEELSVLLEKVSRVRAARLANESLF